MLRMQVSYIHENEKIQYSFTQLWETILAQKEKIWIFDWRWLISPSKLSTVEATFQTLANDSRPKALQKSAPQINYIPPFLRDSPKVENLTRANRKFGQFSKTQSWWWRRRRRRRRRQRRRRRKRWWFRRQRWRRRRQWRGQSESFKVLNLIEFLSLVFGSATLGWSWLVLHVRSLLQSHRESCALVV